MSRKTTELTKPLYEYLLKVGVRESLPLRHLREETLLRFPEYARMQIAPEQGAFLALLVELIGAQRVIEVGVFTGYSTLAMALAMPKNGVVVACDVSEEWTKFGKRFWCEAGVDNRIELHLAPAIETMDVLLASGQAETFDLAFLDAEKTEYKDYYERAFSLIRPGGLIAIDNVLWSGRPADPLALDADTLAIREFNEMIKSDFRVSVSLLPIADGLTLALKHK